MLNKKQCVFCLGKTRQAKNDIVKELVTAAAMLSVLTAPPTLMVLVAAGLGLVPGMTIPGTGWLYDWGNGERTMRENGLHYLLM